MNNLLVRLIRLYRIVSFTPEGTCRFIPSCSRYCEEAISSRGTIKGSWLCFKRILKCNSFLTKQLTYNPVR